MTWIVQWPPWSVSALLHDSINAISPTTAAFPLLRRSSINARPATPVVVYKCAPPAVERFWDAESNCLVRLYECLLATAGIESYVGQLPERIHVGHTHLAMRNVKCAAVGHTATRQLHRRSRDKWWRNKAVHVEVPSSLRGKSHSPWKQTPCASLVPITLRPTRIRIHNMQEDSQWRCQAAAALGAVG